MSERAGAFWSAMGSALCGVLVGGTAVYVGLRDRAPSEVAPEDASGGGAPPGSEAIAVGPTAPMATPCPEPRRLVDAVRETTDTVVTLETDQGPIGAGVVVEDDGLVVT